MASVAGDEVSAASNIPTFWIFPVSEITGGAVMISLSEGTLQLSWNAGIVLHFIIIPDELATPKNLSFASSSLDEFDY